MVPVFARDERVGTVCYRGRSIGGEMFLEVTYRGLVGLVPCRRQTDITEPTAMYVLEDGTLWMAGLECATPVRIVAQVVRFAEE